MKNSYQTLLFISLILTCSSNEQLSLPYTCTTTVCQPGSVFATDNIRFPRQQGLPGKRGGIGQKGDKGDPCNCDVADEKAMQSLRNEWKNQIKQYDEILRRLRRLEDLPENCTMRQKYKSAQESDGDHSDNFDIFPIYPLKFIGDVTPWMTILRRQDGGTDFYRGWESYAKGFGNQQEEFWLGLRNIHKITTKRNCKLRIDMKDFFDKSGWAEYSTFKVADEEYSFRLTVSGYSGNIRDSLTYHNGQRFSTIDRDNDATSSTHCAKDRKGPWWHRSCHDSNLNGEFYKTGTTSQNSVWWTGFSISLSFVEIKVFCQ